MKELNLIVNELQSLDSGSYHIVLSAISTRLIPLLKQDEKYLKAYVTLVIYAYEHRNILKKPSFNEFNEAFRGFFGFGTTIEEIEKVQSFADADVDSLVEENKNLYKSLDANGKDDYIRGVLLLTGPLDFDPFKCKNLLKRIIR